MDKETQVLEMAKILCPKGTANCEKCSKNYKCDVKFSQLAELFDGGCKIVGEDEIVIKKEDANYFTELYREKIEQVIKWRNLCDLKIKETRQETAREILQELKKHLYASYLLPTGLGLPDKIVRYAKITEDDIEQLAKAYEIELE